MSNQLAVPVMSASTVANAATIYSTSYDANYASGFAAALVQLAGSSNVTITQQASIDNTTFYDVVNSAGSAQGAVLSAGTGTAPFYIQFSPVVAKYNRFKVVAGAASTVSISVVYSEQQP